MTPEGIVIGAGSVAFAGNLAEQKAFPANGVQIIGATVALAFLFSLTRNGPLESPTKALAGLMLLAAIYRYVPVFTKNQKKGKKRHG